MYKLKLYNAYDEYNKILINYFQRPDTDAVLTLDNVYFTFNFTRTISAEPNQGNVSIFGLDTETKSKIHVLLDKKDSTITKTGKFLEWEEPTKNGVSGKYVYKSTYPKLVGVDYTTSSPKQKTEDVDFTYKTFSWGKVAIYTEDDILLYVGDVISVKDNIDTIANRYLKDWSINRHGGLLLNIFTKYLCSI
jgi:hypothetical protein